MRQYQPGDQEWPTHESWLTYFVTVSPSSNILSMICFRFEALLSVLPSSPPATHCLSPTIYGFSGGAYARRAKSKLFGSTT